MIFASFSERPRILEAVPEIQKQGFIPIAVGAAES